MTSTSAPVCAPVSAPVALSETIIATAMTETGADTGFRNIRIYGTPDAPLFVARDIQTLLDIADLKYSGKKAEGLYRPGIDITDITISTSVGARTVRAFTERGLIKALHISHRPVAQRFQDFVYVVLKRLTRTGTVTIGDAAADLKAMTERCIRAEREAKINATACDELHAEVMTHREAASTRYQRELDRAMARAATPVGTDTSSQHMINLMQLYGKPVYIMVMPPPAEYRDTYTYDATDPGHIDPTDTDYIYGVQAGKPDSKTRTHASTVYIHSHQTLDAVHAIYRPYALGAHKNMYAASLADLARVATTAFINAITSRTDGALYGLHELLD